MNGIHHTAIVVADLERSIRFYREVLGLGFANEPSPVFGGPELGAGVGVPGAALRQVTMLAGDDAVELIEYVAPPPPLEGPPPQNVVGAHHVAFKVDDIDREVSRLRAAGVEFLSDVNVVDDGVLAGWRWIYFKDPDGITLELVEVAYANYAERRAAVAEYLAAAQRVA